MTTSIYQVKNYYTHKYDPRVTPTDHLIIALSEQNAIHIAEKYNLSYANRIVKYRKVIRKLTIDQAKNLHFNGTPCKIWYECNGQLKTIN